MRRSRHPGIGRGFRHFRRWQRLASTVTAHSMRYDGSACPACVHCGRVELSLRCPKAVIRPATSAIGTLRESVVFASLCIVRTGSRGRVQRHHAPDAIAPLVARPVARKRTARRPPASIRETMDIGAKARRLGNPGNRLAPPVPVSLQFGSDGLVEQKGVDPLRQPVSGTAPIRLAVQLLSYRLRILAATDEFAGPADTRGLYRPAVRRPGS